MENEHIGGASICFGKPVYILSSASIVGSKESEGPLGACFDVTDSDDMFGKKTWEEAESELQRKAVDKLLEKSGYKAKSIDYVFAGDLLGQSIATSFGVKGFEIPHFGLYGACSTCGEALTLASIIIAGGMAGNCIGLASSHFASAEKEFRYPLDYGNQRPLSSSWTVTGSGAFLLSDRYRVNGNNCTEKNSCTIMSQDVRIGITAVTTGKIVDYGIKDSMNMGACMAPAACSTLIQHFEDFDIGPKEYDMIFTGDLGEIGRDILIDLAGKAGYNLSDNLMDCGMIIYDREKQNTNAGGSGCGCSAVVLSSYILPRLKNGTWKKILFMPTGALLSKTSFNEGKSVPGIAHGVVIENLGQEM